MIEIKEALNQTRTYVNNQFEYLKQDPSVNHRLIIMCSLIEAFAQASLGPSRKNQEVFVEFLTTHSKEYKKILSNICPVTLYYDLFDDTNVSLNLIKGRIYSADDIGAKTEGERLLSLVSESNHEKAQRRHCYAGLIYALRNKLVHELLPLNSPMNFHEDSSNPLPHMMCENIMKGKNSVFIRWGFHIPEPFVEAVARETIENYLNDCELQSRTAFHNADRRCLNAWYD